MKAVLPLIGLLALGACATRPAPDAGFLSNYEGLAARGDTLRAAIRQTSDPQALGAVKAVALAPTELAAGADAGWMTEAERAQLLREVDAQLCFELSERYEIAGPGAAADARVRAAVTGVQPTGRVGSAAAAAAGFFIPGPIGVRAPGTLGSLAAEAEMLDAEDRQVAAIAWARTANAVGTDNPSLPRLGDALQFAEPFADAAAAAMSPKDHEARRIERGADPCAQYGPRFRPEGFVAKLGSGLYVPQLSGARGEAPKDD